jgi:hypothetical protein
VVSVLSFSEKGAGEYTQHEKQASPPVRCRVFACEALRLFFYV